MNDGYNIRIVLHSLCTESRFLTSLHCLSYKPVLRWLNHKQLESDAFREMTCMPVPAPDHQHKIHWDLVCQAPEEECCFRHMTPSHSAGLKYRYRILLRHPEDQKQPYPVRLSLRWQVFFSYDTTKRWLFRFPCLPCHKYTRRHHLYHRNH